MLALLLATTLGGLSAQAQAPTDLSSLTYSIRQVSTGQVTTSSFDPSNATFIANSDERSGVFLVCAPRSGGTKALLSFSGPATGPLKLGVYSQAEGSPGRGQPPRPLPSLVAGIPGAGALWGIGEFEVAKIIYAPNSGIAAFSATFRQVSADGDVVVQGEIRYHPEVDQPSVNQRPGVFAGDDQRFNMGAGNQLVGVASDDALPQDGTLNFHWERVAGPAPVTIDNPRTLTTSVTFSQPGTYRFELLATDGLNASRSDQVTYIVIDPNEQTSLTVSREAGNPYYGGVVDQFDLQNANFPVRDHGGYSIPGWTAQVVTLTDGATQWSLALRMPYDGPIRPGTYENVVPYDGDPSQPGFTAISRGLYAFKPLTRMIVHKAIYATRGLRALHATVEQRAVAGGPAVTLEIKYHADFNAASVNQTPGLENLPYQLFALAGLPRPVQVGVFDDGLPAGKPLTFAWEQISGPATAALANPQASATTATFPVPGEYVFRFLASDGEKEDDREVRFFVTEARGSWQGLVELPNLPGQPEQAGRMWVKLTSTATGEFTATLRLAGKRLTLRGTFDGRSTATLPVSIGTFTGELHISPGGNGVTLAANFGSESNPGPGGALISQFRPAYTAPLPKATIGRHALGFLSDTEGLSHAAYGHLTVRANGTFSLVVSLPDGRRVSGSSTLDMNNDFAILIPVGSRGWIGVHGYTAGTSPTIWAGFGEWVRPGSGGSKTRIFKLYLTGGPAVPLRSGVEPLTGTSRTEDANLALEIPKLAAPLLELNIRPGGSTSPIRPSTRRPVFGPGGLITYMTISPPPAYGALKINPGGSFYGFTLVTPGPRLVRFAGVLVGNGNGRGSVGYGWAICDGRFGQVRLSP